MSWSFIGCFAVVACLVDLAFVVVNFKGVLGIKVVWGGANVGTGIAEWNKHKDIKILEDYNNYYTTLIKFTKLLAFKKGQVFERGALSERRVYCQINFFYQGYSFLYYDRSLIPIGWSLRGKIKSFSKFLTYLRFCAKFILSGRAFQFFCPW